MKARGYCPSQDWDRYCQQTELPDECPVCKKPNYDEENDIDVYPADPSFCSKKCADTYQEQCREEAEAEAAQYEEEKRWLAE